MKVNEPFNPHVASAALPANIVFRPAEAYHVPMVFELMAQRNPHLGHAELLAKTRREIEELNDGHNYGVFVVEVDGIVAGFCRFYHSESVPPERVKFTAPAGYYAMGIMVAQAYRRHGLARFLSENRCAWLRDLGADCVYSVVASDNPTSIHMHQAFGFQEIQRGPGFLTLAFEDAPGILYRKDLV